MLSVHYFLELGLHFRHQEVSKPFPVTVEKLAGIWHCTPRYAKLMTRKLSEIGWIDWQAGGGRGHTSVLTLLMESDDILFEEVKRKIGQVDVKEAMDLMSRFGGTSVRSRFMDWLSEGMGFSTKTVSDKLQDTLRFPVYRKIVTLDPGLAYFTFDAHIAKHMFNRLVEFDPETHRLMPGIAHYWENSAEGLEWTFHLKKSIIFHHGRELTAHDVVFTLDRLRLNPDRFECSWMFRDIESITAIDHKTVRIRLTKPNYLFLRMLSTVPSSIVPEEIVSKDEAAFAQKPVGTGPFQLLRLNEAVCVLEAFPAHFLGRPHLDRVELLILPELETGRLKEPDWTSVIYGDTAKVHKEASPLGSDEWSDLEIQFACCTWLVFNQFKRGPQNHPKFREALHYLIDRERMIAELGGDRFAPANGFRPERMDTERAAIPRLERSAIEAMLKESGYQGEPFRLVTSPNHKADANWIRECCKSYGIDMVVDVRKAALTEHPSLSEDDCQHYGNVFSGDEICELKMYLQKSYFLPAFDKQMADRVQEAVESIFREPVEQERQRKLTKLEAMMKESHTILYLLHKNSSTSFHKSVRGVTITPTGWLDFHKIWFRPQSPN